MSVAYVQENSSPASAEQWNALTAELDAILRALYQGKSFFAYTSEGAAPDACIGQRFYFGSGLGWKVIPVLDATASPYNQGDFDAIAAALTIDDYTTDPRLARCSPADWELDGSLHVHTVEHESETYYLAHWDGVGATPILTRERFRKLDVAEIIMESMGTLLVGDVFPWSEEFNKFHFLRFHNLSRDTVSVDLGSKTIVIPPFGCQAVRRTYPAADEWDDAYTYLWAAVSGDEAMWRGNPANNVASLECYHSWLDAVTAYNSSGGFCLVDPTVIWEPTVHPLPDVDTAKRIAEYKWHAGRILAWENADGPTITAHDITPTWAQLEAGTGLIKLTHPATDEIKVEADTGATTPIDAMGVGSTLLPVWPTTLPYTLPTFLGPITTPGVYRDETIEQTWSQAYYTHADPPPLGTPITVESSGWYNTGASFWSVVGGDAWTTLATFDAWENDEDDVDTPEQTSEPTGLWKTDGWRLVYCGTHDILATTESLADVSELSTWWTVADDRMTLSFGADVLDRDSWFHTSRKYGRKCIAYDGVTDLFGQVFHEGNPDVSGTYGIEAGIDWETDRQPQQSATLKRTEELQESIETTLTLPVQPKEDAAERIAENASDVSWYATNRTDLLAGNQEVEDKEQVVKYPILAAHYNHVAQRLNSIKGISPFTILNLLYWGSINDGTWPFGSGSAFPQNYYCAALETGRAYDFGILIEDATESSTTGYYVSLAGIRVVADLYDLGISIQGLHGYRTQLQNPGAGFSHYEITDVGTFQTEPIGNMGGTLVCRHTEDSDGYYLKPPGTTIEATEHILGLEQEINFPEIPDGWELENGSMVLCVPRPGLGWTNNPMEEADEDEWFEPIEAFDPPTGDPGYLPIDPDATGALTFPATHATITSAMGSTGDDRSQWRVTYVRRILLVRA